ncbi:MAG: Hpt domain-containing protein, partial [Methanomicrobiales archaeon]|nr:Hpt domain-containing protein [Methanomicrobiales archaeon]
MTGPDDEFREILLATFREEAEEYLNTITAGLLDLEKTGVDAGTILVERVFRTLHSLKGAARAVSFREIELICQNLETVFSAIKKGEYSPDAEAFDVFFRAIKVTRVYLTGNSPASNGSAEIISTIRGLLTSKKKAELSAFRSAGITHAPSPGVLPVMCVTAPDGLQSVGLYGGDSHPAGITGENSPGIPGPAAVNPPTPKKAHTITGSSATVRIAAHKLDKLIAGSDDLLTTRLFITHRMQELEEMMTRFSHWRWNHARVSSDLYVLREAVAGLGKNPMPPDLVIPLRHMLKFLEYDREFMTYLRHDLGAHIRATERDRSALEAITSEISDLIHDAVLMPVESIMLPFSGFVREYSRATGKKVDLVIEGEGIEMDRRILESLKDPLMHLINNSIDHGIEYPDIRAEHNKPARATVRIRIVPLSGSKVSIEVSDDGAGIDCREVR